MASREEALALTNQFSFHILIKVSNPITFPVTGTNLQTVGSLKKLLAVTIQILPGVAKSQKCILVHGQLV